MTNDAALYDALRQTTDFLVTIAWSGPEDKPFYKALLVSHSHASLISNRPFWGYAIIKLDEFKRLIGLLQRLQRTLVVGVYVLAQPEYYVEIQTAGNVYHCSLGFDAETYNLLHQMAAALEAAHQKPILDIAARVSTTLKNSPP